MPSTPAERKERAAKGVKQTTGGNTKSDQEWMAASEADLFVPNLDARPEGYLYDINYMWNGYAEEVNEDFFLEKARGDRRCTGTAYIRDPSGMYIVDLEWVRLTRPCLRPPSRGGTVCISHGGRIPAVVSAAKQRLAEAADVVSARLVKMTEVRDEEDYRIRAQDRIAAANSVLDRAGIKGGVEVEINSSGFQGVLADLFGAEGSDNGADS